jgi:hypothetical protein
MKDINALIRSLDHVDKEGIRCAALGFSINLFTNRVLSEVAQAVLDCQDLFFQFCPRESIRFYATETMRKHKKVDQKVFGMLELWMKNPQARGQLMTLELKDGDTMLDAPKYLFKVIGNEKGSRGHEAHVANSITLSFPPEFGIERSDEMLDLMQRLCSALPCQSGQAGFAFQCSRYESQTGETFAWKKSLRHPELDIVRIPQDCHAVEHNAVKTVAWLTMVCDEFLDELGGAKGVEKKLAADTERIRVPGGVIYRLGEAPAITDRNKGDKTPSDYKKLYQALRPLIERAIDQSQWFDTGSDDEDDQTEAWYRRFEK